MKKITEEEIKEGALFAFSSYIFFLWIFTFLYKKNNSYAYFHAKQGLVIFLLEILLVPFTLLPLIGRLISFFGFLYFFLLSFLGIYYALTGQIKELPCVGKIAKKIII